jgi:hypothetical protein
VDDVLRRDDVVVYLVHSLGADDFEQVDRRAADTVAAAAGRAGVRQIVYLGAVSRDGRAHRASPRQAAWIVEGSVLTPKLSSWWLHLVTPVNASVARPLVDGLRTPTVAREDSIRDLVPIEPTGFDEAVRLALEPG